MHAIVVMVWCPCLARALSLSLPSARAVETQVAAGLLEASAEGGACSPCAMMALPSPASLSPFRVWHVDTARHAM